MSSWQTAFKFQASFHSDWLSGSGDSELLGCSFHCESSSSELSVPGDNEVPLEKIAFLLCDSPLQTATNKNRDGDEQGVL